MGRTNYSYSSLLSAVIKTLYYRYASYDQNKSTLSDRVTEDAQSSTRRDYSLYPFLQEEYNVDAPQLETLDFIPPLITLIGQNPQILERYANYTDPGATTEYGSTIVSTDYSQVDPTTQGDYEVTYTASDGVNITTGTRVVRVVDTVPPEASLIGDNPYILERYLDYVDPGLNLDQGSFIANIDTSQLNNTVPGDYTITYTVSDGTNEITLTRDITVVDTVSPVITLIGNDPYLHEMYTQYEDPGVALDRGSILTSMDTSQLDINTAGSYTVTYTATDGINTRTASRTVTVADTTSPVITFNGTNPYYVARYTQYNDPGVTVDQGSTLISTDTSQVNTFNLGNYNVVYTANDGFFTSTAIRTVIVKNPPVLTLSGPSQYYVQLGSTYTDPGVTSDSGEDVTIDTSLLNMNNRGTYIVSYTATDITGVSSSASRTVVVDAPILTLSGSDPYYVQLGSTYNDLGATSDNGEVVTVDVSNLDMNTRGIYGVTYSATDNRGFIGTVERIVVVDAPIITLVGSETYYVGVGTTYVDPGATSNGGETVTIDTSALDMNTIGTYTVTYTATNLRGFIGTTTRNIVVDTNIITLIGENPYYVQLGSTFTEPGSTSENEEVITIDSTSVDTTTRGSYTVLHSAVKSNGALSFVSRIVIVDAPVISLIGSNPLYVARDTVYTDPGATSDGGETVTIDSSGVNMNLEDQYTVTYTAVDSRGFIETITRTVIVDDPVFLTLKGDNPQLMGKDTPYTEYGAVSDNLEQVVVDTSTLDINTNGTYTVTYTATRENGIVGTATRTVIVDSPVITPTGDNPYYVQLGSNYTDPGATSDGGETVTIDTSNIVMNTRGSYTVTYSATDSNGFLGTATRTVVVDAPVITLGGTNPQYVLTGTSYSEFGGTSDGGETVTIDSSSIDVNTPASYSVSYTATDSNGFVENITREVVVKNAPVITLLGSNPYYVGRTIPDDGTYTFYNNLIIRPYIDPGFISDGGETVTFNTSSLDMNTNGTYTVTYNTSNTVSGFSSSTVTRSVIVEDPVIIQISGASPIYREIGDSSDPGAVSLTGETITSDYSQVDYNTRGAYTVYYSATNTNGTVGRAFRTVYVREVGNLNPTITLSGDNPYYVQRGSAYADPGATADILETVSVDTSNLNMNTNGTYTVTYTATDVNARSSTTSRTVIVSGPVITLESSDTLLISRGTTYTDPGATSDGGETITKNFGGLNTGVNGVYTITYSATDEMGFVGTATRTVTVGGPTITLQGPNPYYVGQGSLYYDPGAVSSSGEFVKINAGDISLNSQGTFSVTYTSLDANAISNAISRIVIYDSRPGITLYGINPYYVQKDSVFTDPGSISSSGDTITIDTSNVDMNTNGTYYVTHSFTDSLNRFCTMTRTVIVDSPVITLAGDNPQYVVNGTLYAESGATSDGDETVTIDSSSVDTTTNGTYTVTYTATDRDGFVSTVSRTVIVTTPSVITLVGDNPYIVEKDSEYVDPGATSSSGETVTVDTSNLNMTKHLSQYVTYSVTNSDGYVTTLQRTVDVRTGTSRISLSGSNPYYILRGTSYTEPGVTHDDGYSITPVTSSLDENTNGTYNVSYTWLSDTVNRTVIVDSASLTLLGDNPYYVKPYYTYVDPGVTSDNGETVLVDTQYLNINTPGEYIVYYSVRRGDGYLLTTTTRTVIVKEPPVITLLGADPFYMYRGLTFSDPGATSDGGETVTVDISRLNEDVIGTYRVYYRSSNGVIGSAYRNVIIVDKPTILLRGPNPQYLSVESTYEEYGFELTGPGTVTVDTSEIDVNTRGTYTVRYSFGDTVVGRTVIVEGPIITLSGEDPIKLILNEAFDDPGATADGGEDVSAILTNLDTSVSGVQEVKYIASNSRGNTGVARRTVIVTDTAVEQTFSGNSGDFTSRPISPGTNLQISGDGTRILTSTFLSGPNFVFYNTFDYDEPNDTWTMVSNVIEYNFGFAGSSWPYASAQSAITYDGTRMAIANMVQAEIRIYDWDTNTADWVLNDTLSGLPPLAPGQTLPAQIVMRYGIGGAMAFSTDGNTLVYNRQYSRSVTVVDYDPVNGGWTQRGSLIGATEYEYYYSTYGSGGTSYEGATSLAISGDGNRILLGVPRDRQQQVSGVRIVPTGSAIVYEWDPSTSDWVKRGSHIVPPQPTTTSVLAAVGTSVAMSTDGNRIAVGSSNFTPSFLFLFSLPEAAKFTKVYDWDENSNDWVQVGSTLTEVGATKMQMSGAGDRIVMSNGFYNDFSSTAAGRVIVYQYDTNLGDWRKMTQPITGDYQGEYLGYDVAMKKDGSRIATRGRQSIKVFSCPASNFETDAVLLGDNPYYVEQGTTYTDPGVVVTTGETASIQLGDLDMNTAGTYDVHTLVLDQSGTVIRENTRTVIVENGPVISLIGDNPYTVGRGTAYTDPGTTSDGGETVTIDTSALDMNTNGIYTVTYSATNARGYVRTNTRTIAVEAPILRLQGYNPYYIEINKTYEDPGVYSEFGEDVIIDTSNLNITTTGTYTVNYSATDVNGFVGTTSRTVIVDNPPILTLYGTNPSYASLGSIYTDPGAYSDDGESVLVNTANVNTNYEGVYSVYYRTSDTNGLVGRATRSVSVNPPTITLNGDNPYYIQRGDSYSEFGATSDGGETVTINTSNLNANVVGTYVITYSSSKVSGSYRVEPRYVIIDERVITLNGNNPQYVDRGSAYTEFGATADSGDTVTIDSSAVDTNTFGSYTVTYSTVDFRGITGTTTRTVVVDSPILTISGNDPYYHGNGYTYVDPGVTSDGGETVTIDTSQLDVNTNGTYTVYYSVTDVNGLAESGSRTVIVDTAPVVTLVGANPYFVGRTTTYTDPGGTSNGGETVFADTHALDMNTNGTYTVYVSAANANGTIGFATRTVTVRSPDITLWGDNPHYVPMTAGYWDPGLDLSISGPTTSSYTLNTSNLDVYTAGTQSVGYTATDTLYNSISTASRDVKVIRRYGALNAIGSNFGIIYTYGAQCLDISHTGNRVAIGRANYSPPIVNNSSNGIVKIYDFTPSGWIQLGPSIVGASLDQLGYTVSLSGSGTRVAVTLFKANSTSSPAITQVKIFDYISANNTWTQVGQDLDGDTAGDQFGYSVSLSSDGTRVAIGARYNDANGSGYSTGQTRIWEWDSVNGVWIQMGQDIYGEAAGDESGYSVSLSSDGTRVAIGAYLNDGNSSNSGQVRIWEWDSVNSVWTQMGQDLYGEAGYYYCGYSVSLSGDGTRVAIGEFGYKGFRGRARVLEWDSSSNTWIQVANSITASNSTLDVRFGQILSLSSDGTRISVASPYYDGYDGSSFQQGILHVYELNENIQRWVAMVPSVNGSYSATLGKILAMSGNGSRIITNISHNTAEVYDISNFSVKSPIITLNGSNPYYVQYLSTYVDPGFTTDGLDDIFTSNISNVNVLTRGSYTVNYEAYDTFTSNTAYASRIVIVDAPELTLIGDNPYYIGQGQTYIDPGATSVGGETVTSYTSNVNTSIRGTYVVELEAIDNNNLSNVITRDVIVDFRSAIVLTGTSPYYVEKGTTYIDPGATSTGGETVTIDTSNLDMNVLGTYLVTYSVTNVNNLTTINYRHVVVDAPVITLAGENPQNLELGFTYEEYGASSDGGEIVTIDSSNVDINTVGTYTVTYSSTDTRGFSSTVTRNVVVSYNPVWYIKGNILEDDGYAAFGQAISLSSNGMRMAVGAHTEDNAVGYFIGATYIYELDTETNLWSQLGQTIYGESGYDHSAYSVSLSSDGTRVAIGAYGNDGNGSASGHARIWEWDSVNSVWTQMGQDIDGATANEYSGWSVSLSGDGTRVAIGAPFNNASGAQTGHVHIWEWDSVNSVWIQMGQDLYGEAYNDYFGISVSLSGDGTRVAIGADRNDGGGPDSGHVRIWEWDSVNSVWNQMGQDIDGEYAVDHSGYSVSLSSDGTRVAIGAYGNDGNVEDAGHVRIWEWDSVNSVWIQMGQDIDGEALRDYFGYSVSLSSDGTRVAIGAYRNDTVTEDGGIISVYEWNAFTSLWVKIGTNIANESLPDHNFGKVVSISGDGNFVAGSVGDIYKTMSGVSVWKYGGANKYSTLSGPDPYYVGLRTNYTDPGAVTPTGSTLTVSTDLIDMNTRGVYQAYYYTTDTSYGITTITTRDVVVDAPIITLNGPNPGYTLYANVYTDPGATSDGGEIVTIDSSAVDINTLGSYQITYTSVDSNSFTDTIIRNVSVSAEFYDQMGQDIDGEAAGDNSGHSVSLSSDGTRVAIGAPYNDANGTESGHTRIWEWNSGTSTWIQMGQDIDGEGTSDRSGWSVSLSSDGTRVAIGAPYNDANGSGYDFGHTRVWEWNGSAWTQMGQDINGEGTRDQSGRSVSLSGDGTRVAIGAQYNVGNGNGYGTGHTRIWEWNSGTSTWIQIGQDIDSEAADDYSGSAVSLSSDGTRVAIGAYFNDGNGNASGHTRIWEWNSGTSTWIQVGQDIDGEAAEDRSGSSVSLSSDGTRVAIGAVYNDGNGSNSGHTRIWEWNSGTSTWIQMGQDIDGEAANDYSGTSVSLSSDGTRVAIGAHYNDGNGSNSGHTRIWEWNSGTSTWIQIGQEIDGEAADDRSGVSVSLSGDGTRVAIGAYGNDANGSNSGHTRVYEYKSVRPTITLTGDNPYEILRYNEYTDPGATSSGGETVTVDTSSLDTSILASQRVYYSSISSLGLNSIAIERLIKPYEYGTTQNGNLVNTGGNLTGLPGSFDALAFSSDGNIFVIGDFRYNYIYQQGEEGAVYIYTRNTATGSWSLSQTIYGSTFGTGMVRFGTGVDISGDGSTIVVGSMYDNSYYGRVRVFTYSSSTNTWVLAQTINPTTTAQDYFAFFGSSVSISSDGSRIAIGQQGYDNRGANNNNYGRVFVFHLNTTTNTYIQSFVYTGPSVYEVIGYRVAISGNGNVLVASGIRAQNSNTGIIRLFKYDSINQNWNFVVAGYGSTNGRLGLSLDISYDGLRVIAGEPGSNSSLGRIWYFDTTSALDILGIESSPSTSTSLFGNMVGISDDGSLFGTVAPMYNNYSGLAQLYTYEVPVNLGSQLTIQNIGPNITHASSTETTGICISGDKSRVCVVWYNAGGSSTGFVIYDTYKFYQ